jgi:hypothetical protein
MPEPEQTRGWFRRWLEKRREARRRGAEMTARRNAARKSDMERAARHGNIGSGDPGPFGGG